MLVESTRSLHIMDVIIVDMIILGIIFNNWKSFCDGCSMLVSYMAKIGTSIEVLAPVAITSPWNGRDWVYVFFIIRRSGANANEATIDHCYQH